MPIKDREERRKYHREWAAKRRQQWMESAGPCVLCGSTANLEIDHIDPASKINHRIWSWAKKRREAELAKCRVLCRKCHVARHAEERVRHGSVARYRAGCRCVECVIAMRTKKARQKSNLRERLFGGLLLPYIATSPDLADRQRAMRDRWSIR